MNCYPWCLILEKFNLQILIYCNNIFKQSRLMIKFKYSIGRLFNILGKKINYPQVLILYTLSTLAKFLFKFHRILFNFMYQWKNTLKSNDKLDDLGIWFEVFMRDIIYKYVMSNIHDNICEACCESLIIFTLNPVTNLILLQWLLIQINNFYTGQYLFILSRIKIMYGFLVVGVAISLKVETIL